MARLKQTITRWQGMGLIATTLLGTGVFILPQLTLEAAGQQALWVWLLLLVAVLPLAFVFARLGQRYSHAAGPAYFTELAFGKSAGQIIGLLFLATVPLGVSAALMMTFAFITPLVDLSGSQLLVAQLSAVMLIFLLNRRGLQLSGRVQLALTLAIVAVVAVMLITALWQGASPKTVMPEATDNGFATALGLAIWSFLGVEAISHLASEFRDVKRDFAPATIGGVCLVGLVFMACTYLSSLAPEHELAMVGSYEMLLGDSGRWVVGLLGFISGLATINVYFASLARLAWSFSEQGVLPAGLSRLNSFAVPSTALSCFAIFCAVIVTISALLQWHFAHLVHWVNGVFVLVYGVSTAAAWKLLGKSARPVVLLAGCGCILFIYCLGSAFITALLVAGAIAVWQLSPLKLDRRISR